MSKHYVPLGTTFNIRSSFLSGETLFPSLGKTMMIVKQKVEEFKKPEMGQVHFAMRWDITCTVIPK